MKKAIIGSNTKQLNANGKVGKDTKKELCQLCLFVMVLQ